MTQFRDDKLLMKMIAKLKELREAKGVSQQGVYEDIDIHIARIESKKTNLTVSTLARLCKYYKISLVDFFRGLE